MKKQFILPSSQSGRSMVEMLGTLAIIGVLSIGGIAGYSYGMDKYRANQTIQDINLRMMDLMTQLNNHPDSYPNISNEWGTKGAFYPMDVAYDYETLEYALEVSDVPKQVCKMVFDGLITTYSIEIGTERRVAPTDENLCGDNNTMAFYLEETVNEKCGNVICPACQKCDADTQSCVTVRDYETRCAVSDTQYGWCVSGACEPDSDVCNCTQKQYCADTNEDSYTPHPSGCKDLNFKKATIDGITYYLSNETMSWWDAISACKALGNKNLVSSEELAVGQPDAQTNNTILYEQRTDLAYAIQEQLTDGKSFYVWISDNPDTYPDFYGIRFSFPGAPSLSNPHAKKVPHTNTVPYALCR